MMKKRASIAAVSRRPPHGLARFLLLSVCVLAAAPEAVRGQDAPDADEATAQHDVVPFERLTPGTRFPQPAAGDSDGDNLTDAVENGIGTDPFNVDSDCDGKDDGVEVGANTGSPTDSDSDGKIDALESAIADSDKDGTVDEMDASTATWQLSCAQFVPFAVKNDKSEASWVEVRVLGASNPTQVKLKTLDVPSFLANIFVDGVASEEIVLFDDGTHGDPVAGDGLWSREGITSDATQPVATGKTTTRGWFDVEVTDDSGTNFKRLTEIKLGLVELAVVDPAAVAAATLHRDNGDGAFGSKIWRTGNVINLAAPQGLIALRKYLLQQGGNIAGISQEIYSAFPDVFDFILAFPEVSVPGGAAGLFTPVRNDVSGLGIGTFDNSGAFGSAGQLQGFIGMNWGSNGPSLHEVAHRWGVNLDTSLGFQACQGAHWGWSGVGKGQLGGFSTVTAHSTDGSRVCMDGFSFANGGDSVDYVPIELYLMGLVPSGDVAPMTVLTGFDCGTVMFNDPNCVADADAKTSIVASTGATTIGDVIAQHGARVPDSTTSQKAFRSAFVVVSQYELTDTEMAFFDVWAKLNEAETGMAAGSTVLKSFKEATGARATMNTTAPTSLDCGLPNTLTIQNTAFFSPNFDQRAACTSIQVGANVELFNGASLLLIAPEVSFTNDTTFANTLEVDNTL